ncbi:uncharacterized protein LOC141549205 [Sminthopsis crassicaudata]|uniref:uncharacterized protein LOC141549205 n=1 Tax=Sminthopsis crassicaudata TaxID=9301 RepID=UPI003D68A30B
MGGGVSRPWLEQPVRVRPGVEVLLRHNYMQIPMRRVAERRPGPQPPPGAWPGMMGFQLGGGRLPPAGHGRGITTSQSVPYARVGPVFHDLFMTVLGSRGEGIPGVMPSPMAYSRWPYGHPHIHPGALIGAGDGRMRAGIQLRRAPIPPDPQRGPHAVPHSGKYRRCQTNTEGLLAALIKAQEEISAIQAPSQAPDHGTDGAAVGDSKDIEDLKECPQSCLLSWPEPMEKEQEKVLAHPPPSLPHEAREQHSAMAVADTTLPAGPEDPNISPIVKHSQEEDPQNTVPSTSQGPCNGTEKGLEPTLTNPAIPLLFPLPST